MTTRSATTIRSAFLAALLVLSVCAVGTTAAIQESTTESDATVSINTNSEGVVEVMNGSSATISGTSSLESGTNVTVVVRFDNNQFLDTKPVTVGENGEWETTYDLSSIDVGSEFAVSVRRDSGSVANADGVVVETKSDSESAMPGFGLSAALVALTATAFVARRRA